MYLGHVKTELANIFGVTFNLPGTAQSAGQNGRKKAVLGCMMQNNVVDNLDFC